MTNPVAIEILKKYKAESEEDYYVKRAEALGMAIEALENQKTLQEELEDIKAELNNLDFDFGNYYDETESILNKINSVLDKHIKEVQNAGIRNNN